MIALAGSACSSGKNSGQVQVTKPAPQVRVEALPSSTATLTLPDEPIVPASEVTATLAQVYIWPTPDENAIIAQINAMMDEIDRKLKSQDFILKP